MADKYTEQFTRHLPAPMMARAKSEQQGLSGRTEFLKMDAETLEFENSAFDTNPGR